MKIVYTQDGDHICAHLTDFTNLQASPAGFGATEEEALGNLVVDLMRHTLTKAANLRMDVPTAIRRKNESNFDYVNRQLDTYKQVLLTYRNQLIPTMEVET